MIFNHINPHLMGSSVGIDLDLDLKIIYFYEEKQDKNDKQNKLQMR